MQKICISKWVGLDNKNSLKRLALTVKGLNREGLLSEGFMRGEGAYYRNFMVLYIHI